jgi:hypothetical protein
MTPLSRPIRATIPSPPTPRPPPGYKSLQAEATTYRKPRVRILLGVPFCGSQPLVLIIWPGVAKGPRFEIGTRRAPNHPVRGWASSVRSQIANKLLHRGPKRDVLFGGLGLAVDCFTQLL